MAAKSIRFSQVVEKAGRPESYTLWAKPDQDKVFASLLKQNRVMTVHQETVGSKADYGEIGYIHDLQSTLLVFPKSLKRFEGRRIIGIKYDELEETSATEPERKPKQEPARSPKKAAPPKKPPKEEERIPAAKPKKEKPAPGPKAKKEKPVPAPPPNQIPFPKQEIARRQEGDEALEAEKVENLAKELATLKKEVRKALDALSKDKAVTAYNLLTAAITAR